MAGFANYGQLGNAVINGQTSFCSFRKVPSQASVAGRWADLSMASGNPLPNYYASTPLQAAVLDGARGIFHGYNKTPSALRLLSIQLQTPTAAFVGRYTLLDYLLYYPFVDGDNTDLQEMDNTTTLPRYTDGAGVMAMYVCLAPTTGGGSFTFSYVNQDGVTKTSPTHFYTTTASNIASILTSQPATNAGIGPFLRLADGDTGIRSIVSVTNLVPNGGLGSIVLVRPLVDLAVREINTPIENTFGDARQTSQEIKDGAYLGLIVNCAGSIAAGTLTGFCQFVWN